VAEVTEVHFLATTDRQAQQTLVVVEVVAVVGQARLEVQA
jgi:hypothetical protein